MTTRISSYFQIDAIDLAAPHPFRREGLLARTLPFLVPALLGFATLAVGAVGSAPRPGWLVAAAVLTPLIIAAVRFLPWHRMPADLAVAPPLLYVVNVFLMREGIGAAPSIYSPLLVIPLFWLALYGTRKHLLAGFAVAGVTAVASNLMNVFPPHFARFQFLAAVVTPVVCLTAQNLVLQIREQAKALAAAARIDVLTGLSNRRDWEMRLLSELARAGRTGTPCCVAVLDLDNFKRLNDTFGHAAGDAVLRDSAAAWRLQLRLTDVLARYGGEEFAVFLPACNLDYAVAVVERMRAVTAGGQTCSAGVALWNGRESPAELIERADAGLYHAKSAGRNRVARAA